MIGIMVFSNGSEAFKGVGAPSLESEVSGECGPARCPADDVVIVLLLPPPYLLLLVVIFLRLVVLSTIPLRCSRARSCARLLLHRPISSFSSAVFNYPKTSVYCRIRRRPLLPLLSPKMSCCEGTNVKIAALLVALAQAELRCPRQKDAFIVDQAQ